MGQKGFFDIERRLEAISAKGDPLETIKKIVPWEDFRAGIEAVTETKPDQRKSKAGRKPYCSRSPTDFLQERADISETDPMSRSTPLVAWQHPDHDKDTP